MTDNTISRSRTVRGSTSPENPDSKRGTRRKDWGYTDQYRRMMQRDSRRTPSSKEEEEL